VANLPYHEEAGSGVTEAPGLLPQTMPHDIYSSVLDKL